VTASPITEPHPIVPLGCQKPIQRRLGSWDFGELSRAVVAVAKLDEEARDAGVGTGVRLSLPDDPLPLNLPPTAKPAILALVGEQEVTTFSNMLVLVSQPQVSQEAQHPEGAGALGQVVVALNPVAVRFLGSQQLSHRRPGGNRRPRFVHLWIIDGSVEKIDQRPVTHRWILWLQQPG
jgi:hypothetical protein